MTDSPALEFVLNDRDCYTIRRHGDYLVELIPQLFGNFLLVLTEAAHPEGYSFGWRYTDGTVAALAALAWDLDAEDEPPLGWVKRIPDMDGRRRRAPNRPEDAGYRCMHGQWEDCRFVGCEKWADPRG